MKYEKLILTVFAGCAMLLVTSAIYFQETGLDPIGELFYK